MARTAERLRRLEARAAVLARAVEPAERRLVIFALQNYDEFGGLLEWMAGNEGGDAMPDDLVRVQTELERRFKDAAERGELYDPIGR